MVLWGVLAAEGWLDLCSLTLATFAQVGLPITSSDREVWRFAQAKRMVLLTHNRNMRGEHSLEQTIREENGPISLPVLTIGRIDRLRDRSYRERCTIRLVEISLDEESHLGAGRIYVP